MSIVSTRRTRARLNRGFTLVELMVTLAVAAILLMIAVPSFQRLMLNNRLNTTANALVNAINVARMDAIKLNATTQFCGSTAVSGGTLSTACGTMAGAVYAFPQSAVSATQVQAPPPGIASPVQIASGGVTAVRFSGGGFGYAPTGSSDSPYGGNVAVICVPESQLPGGNQRIVSMTAGSILAVATSTGSCP